MSAYSSAFTQADGALSTTDWTTVLGAFSVVTNVPRTNAATTCLAMWNGALAGVDHTAAYQPITTTGASMGVVVRGDSASATTYYFARLTVGGSSTMAIFRNVAGTVTALTTEAAVTRTGSAILSLTVRTDGSGNPVLSATYNGVSQTFTDTDASKITTGLYTGIRIGATSGMTFDNWVAADVVTVTGSTGITSAEAFGSTGAQVVNNVAYVELASAQMTMFRADLQPVTGSTGIATAETFGAGGTANLTLTATAGIGSAETFGAGGAVSASLTGSAGLASAETFGAGGTVGSGVSGAAGIASAEAFGTAGALVQLGSTGATGIGSAQAFGTTAASVSLTVLGTAGLASAELVGTGGTVLLGQPVSGSAGIASAQAFGATGGQAGLQVAGSAGLPSAGAFGTPGTVSTATVGTAGIGSAETFGVGSVSSSLGGAGISSQEAFGAGAVVTSRIIGLTGIGSGQAFGLGQLGLLIAGLTGIASAEAFGIGRAVPTVPDVFFEAAGPFVRTLRTTGPAGAWAAAGGPRRAAVTVTGPRS